MELDEPRVPPQRVEVTDIIVSQQAGMGEFNTAPHTYGARSRLDRMIDHLAMLAQFANTQHEQANFDPMTREMKREALNKITRLTLNEFSLFTRDTPLSMEEFRALHHAVEMIASQCHENLHLIFASVAVAGPDNSVHNMVIHAQCGPVPQLDTFAKSVPSHIDAVYQGKINPAFTGIYYSDKVLNKMAGGMSLFDTSKINNFQAFIRANRNRPLMVSHFLSEAKKELQNDKYSRPPEELIECIDSMIAKANRSENLAIADCTDFEAKMSAYRDVIVRGRQDFDKATTPTYPLPKFISQGDGAYSYKEHVEYAAECALNPATRSQAYNQLLHIKNWLIYTHANHMIYPVPLTLFNGIDALLQKLSHSAQLSKQDVKWFVEAMNDYKNDCHARFPRNPDMGKFQIPLQQITLPEMFTAIVANGKKSETRELAIAQLDHLKSTLIHPSPELLKNLHAMRDALVQLNTLKDFTQLMNTVGQQVQQRKHIPRRERNEFRSQLADMLRTLESRGVDTDVLRTVYQTMEERFTKMENRERLFQIKIKFMQAEHRWKDMDVAQLGKLVEEMSAYSEELKKDFGFNESALRHFTQIKNITEKMFLHKAAIAFRNDFKELSQSLRQGMDIPLLEKIQAKLNQMMNVYDQFGYVDLEMHEMKQLVDATLSAMKKGENVRFMHIKKQLLQQHSHLDATLDFLTRRYELKSYDEDNLSGAYLYCNDLLAKLENHFVLTLQDQAAYTDAENVLSSMLVTTEAESLRAMLTAQVRCPALLQQYHQQDLVELVINGVGSGSENNIALAKQLFYIQQCIPPHERAKLDSLITDLHAGKIISPERLAQLRFDLNPYANQIKNVQYFHFPQGTAQHILNFDTTVECRTKGGVRFTTGVDICLDHAFSIARQNTANLSVGSSATPSFFSSVLTSNSMPMTRENFADPFGRVTHADIVAPPFFGLGPISSSLSQTQMGVRDLRTQQILATSPQSTMPAVDASKYPSTVSMPVGTGMHVIKPPFGPDCVIYRYQPHMLMPLPAYQNAELPPTIRSSATISEHNKPAIILPKLESLLKVIEASGLTEAQRQIVSIFRMDLNKMQFQTQIDKQALMSLISQFKTAMVQGNPSNKEAVMPLIDKLTQYVNVKVKEASQLQQPTLEQPRPKTFGQFKF